MGAPEVLAQTLHAPDSGVGSAPLSQPPVSASLGERYLSRQVLGEGGFGIVVRAIDRTIGREVAVKTLHRPGVAGDDPGARREFLDEARLVANLDHPNVIPVHDVGVDDEGRPFFVMKLVAGQTLDEVLTRLREGDPRAHAEFCFETRVALFERLLDALAHAHANGIVHRDVKPSNVMIGRHGEVYLLDWGIAARIGEQSTAVGTPPYMAPEQVRGEPVDVSMDVYAACLLLYELLSLRQPFDDCTEVQRVFDAVLSREVPLASDVASEHQSPVPMDLSWLCDKGLAKDPSRRYRTIDELRARVRERRQGRIPVQCGQTLVKRGLFELVGVFERHPLLPTIVLVASLVALFAVVVLARAL